MKFKIKTNQKKAHTHTRAQWTQVEKKASRFYVLRANRAERPCEARKATKHSQRRLYLADVKLRDADGDDLGC